MAAEEIRWKQRFTSFRNSLENFTEGLETKRPNKLERQRIWNWRFAEVSLMLCCD